MDDTPAFQRLGRAGRGGGDVTLSFCAGEVRLQIADDGRGFDPASAPGPETGHFGLIGLRERLQRMGGTLQIVSAPGAGARLLAAIPMPQP